MFFNNDIKVNLINVLMLELVLKMNLFILFLIKLWDYGKKMNKKKYNKKKMFFIKFYI